MKTLVIVGIIIVLGYVLIGNEFVKAVDKINTAHAATLASY